MSAFSEFQRQLAQQYPSLPVPEFEELPDNLIDELSDYLISMLPGNVEDESFEHYRSRRPFVFCNGNEKFAQAYREQNELAHWGVAIPCKLAIAWVPRKYLVWHETLHLLNAKDCYNKFGINKCPNPRCIMRRAPMRETCGNQLTLCSKNLKRIQTFSAELAAHAQITMR